MRSHARCSSREAARFAISKHCRARNRHSLGSPSMAPTFLPGGSSRLSVTGACHCYYPVINEGCAFLGMIASPNLASAV